MVDLRVRKGYAPQQANQFVPQQGIDGRAGDIRAQALSGVGDQVAQLGATVYAKSEELKGKKKVNDALAAEAAYSDWTYKTSVGLNDAFQTAPLSQANLSDQLAAQIDNSGKAFLDTIADPDLKRQYTARLTQKQNELKYAVLNKDEERIGRQAGSLVNQLVNTGKLTLSKDPSDDQLAAAKETVFNSIAQIPDSVLGIEVRAKLLEASENELNKIAFGKQYEQELNQRKGWVDDNIDSIVDAFVTPTAPNGVLAFATKILMEKEGFRSQPYYDVTRLRAGYGSDTYTTADGKVHRVTKDSHVTRADADRDIARRTKIFYDAEVPRVGKETWESLPETARGALVSVAYNYGALPKSVVTAAKTGDVNKIATAVEGLQGHNKGINRKRRLHEAAIIRASKGAVASDNISFFAEKNWTSFMREKHPELLNGVSRDIIDGLREDPRFVREALKWGIRKNTTLLQRAGEQVSMKNIQLQQMVGPQAGIRFLQAPPDDRAEDYADPDHLAANPEFYEGKTVSDITGEAEQTALDQGADSVDGVEDKFTFRSLDYDTRQQEKKDALSRFNGEQTERVGRKTAQYDKMLNETLMGIREGRYGAGHIAGLVESGQITSYADAVKLDSALDKYQEDAKFLAMGHSLINKDIVGNPNNPDHRKAINSVFTDSGGEEVIQNRDVAGTVAIIGGISNGTNVFPQEAMQTLNAMVNGRGVKDNLYALEVLASLRNQQQEGGDFYKNLNTEAIAMLGTYDELSQNNDQETIATLLGLGTDTRTKQAREELREVITEHLDDDKTFSRNVSAITNRWFGSDKLSETSADYIQMKSEWENIYIKSKMLGPFISDAGAVDAANEGIKKNWGGSDLGGSGGRVMKFPPEEQFPSVPKDILEAAITEDIKNIDREDGEASGPFALRPGETFILTPSVNANAQNNMNLPITYTVMAVRLDENGEAEDYRFITQNSASEPIALDYSKLEKEYATIAGEEREAEFEESSYLDSLTLKQRSELNKEKRIERKAILSDQLEEADAIKRAGQAAQWGDENDKKWRNGLDPDRFPLPNVYRRAPPNSLKEHYQYLDGTYYKNTPRGRKKVNKEEAIK